MKITDMKLYFMPHRFLLLKIETDAGICGWGEPLVEGRAATLEASVNEWRDYFIGKDRSAALSSSCSDYSSWVCSEAPCWGRNTGFLSG